MFKALFMESITYCDTVRESKTYNIHSVAQVVDVSFDLLDMVILDLTIPFLDY